MANTSFLFANNRASRLADGVTTTSTELKVLPNDGDLFPEPDYEYTGGEFFAVTLRDPATDYREICYCTGRSGDTLTVLRGREGTIPYAFPANSELAMQITAGILEYLRDL